MKQSKLRKKRVVRYAVLYFSLFFLFLILIIGPTIAAGFISPTIDIMDLQQPTNWNNNDTLGSSDTGTALASGAAATGSASGGSAFASSSGAAKRAFFYYGA